MRLKSRNHLGEPPAAALALTQLTDDAVMTEVAAAAAHYAERNAAFAERLRAEASMRPHPTA